MSWGENIVGHLTLLKSSLLNAKVNKAESSVSGNFDANIDAQMDGSLKLKWFYFLKVFGGVDQHLCKVLSS